MLSLTSLVFSVFVSAAWSADELSFPAGFKFGVASAAYQVEGAWNVSDKGESIWDRFTHRHPSPIADRSTGDVACDSYHLWREDVRMLTEIGAHFYRFSISWPRLLPNGTPDHVSTEGSLYYSQLIDALLENNIEPVVTIYHWDLPQSLQDLGGWSNPLIAEWFGEYARVVYSLYGDRVRRWITINESWLICDIPYMGGIFAPDVVSELGAYLCTKNVLMAHATAWRIYHDEFKHKYHGVVSIANHDIWMEAWNDTDEETAELVRQYQEGRFGHPIYSEEGGWPPAVEEAIAHYSQKQGYPWSLLPAFTDQEIQFVKGTYDFYALNFYSARRVRSAAAGERLAAWPLGDLPLFRAKLDVAPTWPATKGIFVYYPESIRKQLAWLKNTYGDIPVFITESGYGASDGGLEDHDRVNYYNNYLNQVLLSIHEDGVNVTGYTAWTLMDNFEWMKGYQVKFGLFEVDFSSPLRTRTARHSARYFASVASTRRLRVPDDITAAAAPKSSKPEESSTQYVVFGGIILVMVAGAVAATVGWRLRRRTQHAAHKNAAQNGDRNSFQNGARSDAAKGQTASDESKIPLTS